MTIPNNNNIAVKITNGFWLAQILYCGLWICIVKASWGFMRSDISRALAFYGVYHRDPRNQWIHFLGVPAILWTAITFASMLPFPIAMNLGRKNTTTISFLPYIDKHNITWGTITTAWYIGFYIYMDPFGGSLFALVLYVMYAYAVYWVECDRKQAAVSAAQVKKKEENGRKQQVLWTGTGKLLRTLSIIHVFAWYAQIHPGHAIFEGAKPALLESLGGALSSAPLFAFYEGLWFVGIHRQLQQQTHVLVEQYTKELCAAGAIMRACESL
jgi:uncharacterized membrane protein YGL010W